MLSERHKGTAEKRIKRRRNVYMKQHMKPRELQKTVKYTQEITGGKTTIKK